MEEKIACLLLLHRLMKVIELRLHKRWRRKSGAGSSSGRWKPPLVTFDYVLVWDCISGVSMWLQHSEFTHQKQTLTPPPRLDRWGTYTVSESGKNRLENVYQLDPVSVSLVLRYSLCFRCSFIGHYSLPSMNGKLLMRYCEDEPVHIQIFFFFFLIHGCDLITVTHLPSCQPVPLVFPPACCC